MQNDKSVEQPTEKPVFIRQSPYRTLVEQMRNGYAYCRMIVEGGLPVDFIFESVNPAFTELTGLTNVAGRKISELFPEILETNPELIERLGRIAETGIAECFEYYLKPLKRLYGITAYSHKKGCFVVLFDDIPERKQAAEELRHSEEQFRKLFESHSAVQLHIDPDTGKIMNANHAAAEFYGWSIEELRKMRIGDINTLRLDIILNKMQNTIAGRQNKFSFRHRRANRSIRDVEVYCSKIWINGKFIINSIVHDVTERKRFEALSAFRRKQLVMVESCSVEELLRSTLDEAERVTGSSIGFVHFIADDQQTRLPWIWSSNTQNKIGLAEGTAQLFSRYETGIWADLIGEKKPVIRNDFCIFSPDTGMPEARAEVRRLMFVPVSRGKVVMVILGIGSRPDDYDEDDARWVITLADITWDIVAKKRAEEDREKLQGELQHSQKMEMLGKLAGGIAHDFNNMLGVILGHTEMAIESGKFSLDDLECIQNAASRSAALTHQLLAFARKQFMMLQILELNTMVEEMRPMLGRLIGENITLLWIPGTGQSRVKIDPSQIDQILINLCVNSRDAIDGTGVITIETSLLHVDKTRRNAAHPCRVPGDYVMLAVSDDGCGIEKKYLANIFEPFFTTKGVGNGTGLGLSTVYGIVKQNNGYIECNSSSGKGTTFNIYLPLHLGETDEIEHEPTEPDQVPLVCHDKKTILLVEDEADILYVCKNILEENGYAVLEASKPAAAIQIAEKYKEAIDLLLTDVIMPEMNGSDLSKKLQSISPNLKTLFMSGYTADVIAPHGIFDDGIHFIEKPFTGKKLIKTVEKTLKAHKSHI